MKRIMLAAALTLLCLPAHSQTVEGREKPASAKPMTTKPAQAVVASKTVKFATIAKTSPDYKSAVDAHSMEKIAKMVGQTGAFKGKISKVFERGSIIIFDFDPDFKTAITAVLRGSAFSKFPDVKTLDGKEVLISGKFEDYKGKSEIVLTKPEQVKLVK